MYDSEKSMTGRVTVDGDEIVYLDSETYDDLETSFDAVSYVPET